MTRETRETDTSRRGFLSAVAATAAATVLPGVGAADEQEAREALFGGAPTVGDRIFSSGSFVAGFVAGIVPRNVLSEAPTQDIDRLVEDTVEEFETHREEWLMFVNTRGLGDEDHQSLGLTFEFEGETRERYVLADWDDAKAEYADVQVELEFDDTPDVTATLRADAVENAADELAELHEEYIVPDEDIERSHVMGLAGRYYFGSDHITTSLVGGE